WAGEHGEARLALLEYLLPLREYRGERRDLVAQGSARGGSVQVAPHELADVITGVQVLAPGAQLVRVGPCLFAKPVNYAGHVVLERWVGLRLAQGGKRSSDICQCGTANLQNVMNQRRIPCARSVRIDHRVNTIFDVVKANAAQCNGLRAAGCDPQRAPARARNRVLEMPSQRKAIRQRPV